MTTITITRGVNPGTNLEFIAQVKWLPGMGDKNAKLAYGGAPVTITIPPDKQAMAMLRVKTLVAAGVISTDQLATPKEEPPMISTPTPAPTATPAPGISLADLEALRRLFGATLDEKRVVELIQQHGGRPAHVTIDLVSPTVSLSGEAVMHYKFPLLAAAVAARVNVLLVGPAGSGKTTAVEKAAKALGLPFYATGAVNSEYKLTGFIDAQGRIVSTAFRKAFEEGGLFLFGETDASMPGALLAFNTALANDWMDFPDGVVKKHPDFRVVADANTFGTGADRLYVGRNQLDAASLDRYAVIDWDYDEALEAALLGLPAPKGSPVPASIAPLPEVEVQGIAARWFERVRTVRKAVVELKVRHVVSPRATLNGVKLLAAGWSWADTEQAVIWKGMDADTKTKVAAKAA